MHYTRSVPSGKSWYFQHGSTLVVYSIPANMNIARFLIEADNSNEVIELSRLWAPDGHPPNELTQALSSTIPLVRDITGAACLVSFADPNAGHHGGVYQAASWTYCGQSDETRMYQSPNGGMIPRRAFHAGRRSMSKDDIEARGYVQTRASGKHRYAKGLTAASRAMLKAKFGAMGYPKPNQEYAV